MDPKNQTTTFGYDNANRLTSVAYHGGNTVTYGYNAASALTSMVDSTGTTTYSLDALYRLTGVTTPDGQGGTKTVSYGYDAVGNLTSLTYPDNKQVSYSYNAANQLSGVTSWSNQTTTVQYDAIGRATSVAQPNGVTETYSYDTASRLIGINLVGPSATPVGSVSYGYDAASRVTSLTDAEGTTAFGYDNLDRLTSATYPNGTTTYAYDAVGNRTSQTVNGTPTTYTYDNADRLTQAGNTTYTYDANGNLTGRGSDTFTWDSADRLTSATVGGTTASMTYDGADHLVAQTIGGTTTRFIYDQNQPLPQLLTEGSSTYLYGPGMAGGFGPIMEEVGGSKRWLHSDAIGSSRFLTDAAGATVASSTYDVFGAPRQQTGTQSRFGFAGQAEHDDLGLINMRARWYDPAVGRFISADPLPGSASNPQSLNAYSYAYNNPCTLRDPSGMSPEMGGSGGGGDTVGPVTHGYGAGTAVETGLAGADRADPGNTAPFWLASGKSACALPGPADKPSHPIRLPTLEIPPLEIEGNLGQRIGALFAWLAKVFDAVLRFMDELATFYRYVPSEGGGGRSTGSPCVGGGGGGGGGSLYQRPDIEFDEEGYLDRNRRTDSDGPIRRTQIPRNPECSWGNWRACAVAAFNWWIGDNLRIAVDESLPLPQRVGAAGLVVVEFIPVTKPVGVGVKGVRGATAAVRAACSFSADTAVATPEGPVPIAELKPGDWVLAYHEPTGTTGSYQVTAVHVQEHAEVLQLTIEGEVITTTAEHPFYAWIANANGWEWTPAGHLQAGDQIRNADGASREAQVGVAIRQQHTMYNLSVADAQTFFVGDDNWLVHNTCPIPPTRALRPVGSALESINDVLHNPQLLSGRTPGEVEALLRNTPGWQVERLRQGAHEGQGWVFREYNAAGNLTGRMLRWHPGGGQHGEGAYWRVTNYNTNSGIIR